MNTITIKAIEDAGYIISNTGVYSTKTNKVLKPHNFNGYEVVSLHLKTRRVKGLLHRLIGMKHIANPKDKPCINHKNGIKNDNRIENLEWATYAENSKHAFDTGLSKITLQQREKIAAVISKKVIDKSTGMIYTSIKEAAQAKSFNYSTLKNQLNGTYRNKTTLSYSK